MTSRAFSSEIGIGATDELSLRVSVATLIRVLFENPRDGEITLALERKATFLESHNGNFVDVKSQPFGGALRFLDPSVLQREIGDFHFDSEESHAECDFRIFIRPSAWKDVRDFCLEHLRQPNDTVLESDPTRELTEEFEETLGVNLKPDQYAFREVGAIIEDHPAPTENVRARGYPTVRIYRLFEAHVLDPVLASAMIKKGVSYSDQDLRELALQDSGNGGFGRANTVLTLPFKEVSDFYSAIPLEARNSPTWFHDHQLDETVAAVLDGLTVLKYRRL